MTSDDIISMLKACEQVIDNINLARSMPNSDRLSTVENSIIYLATVQRDLLEGLIK